MPDDQGKAGAVATHPAARTKALYIVLGFVLSTVLSIATDAVFGETIGSLARKAMWEMRGPLPGPAPDCSNQRGLVRIPADDLDASATRTYTDEDELRYQARKTLDGEPTTAWVGSFPGSSPLSITWVLPSTSRKVRLLCVRNGFTGNGRVYLNNQRIREAQLRGCGLPIPVELHDGDPRATPGISLAWRRYQEIAVNCDPKNGELTLRIVSTFPARDHSHQVAISDVKIYVEP